MSLASLTQAAHQNAERQAFAREMMSGNMRASMAVKRDLRASVYGGRPGDA